MLTAPLRSAVSGDVPAHSGVSAPCGVGYANMCIRNLLDEPSELVNNVVESGKRPEGPLWRLVRLRPISLTIIPVQGERVSWEWWIDPLCGLTRMDCGRHDFITMPPSQFLGEYNVPLVG